MSFNFLDGIALWSFDFFTQLLIPFLLALTIVVFFHELGHFLVARWCGVKVMVFSIGFGPEIVGFNDRRGTRWKISAIPLGGYVKFFGDDTAASTPDPDAVAAMSAAERRQSFHHQPVAGRAAIVAAGPIANFILAIAIFACLFMFHGKPSTSALVDSVQPNTPAAAAGFQPGDLIVAINGKKIDTFLDLQRLVMTSAGVTLSVDIARGDQKLTLSVVPALREQKDNFGNVQRIGVLGIGRSPSAQDAKLERAGPVEALQLGVKESWFVVERTMSYLAGVVVGRERADQIGGPIRIAEVTGKVWKSGLENGGLKYAFLNLFQLAALLSVSIGLLNLFPIPLLDGGHLLFYAIEAARGRPLSERAQEYGFRIGLTIVLMLMIFATFNDIMHLARLT